MNMKKMIFFALAGVMSLGLAACSGENIKTTSGDSIPPASSQTASGPQNKERPESVTIISLNASKEETELEVPYDPSAHRHSGYGFPGYPGCPGRGGPGRWHC